MTVEYLKETFSLMNRRGAPGVDRVSMTGYGRNLDDNVADLVDRMKRRAYDAPPVRRVYIPKTGSDKLRPLGIPAVEDRLLQAAVARLLSAIYEPIFRDSSFGFRPGRSAHDALRRVREAVMGGRVQYVYEADIRGFFNHLDHDWLMRMLELKVGDPWILRLVRKWLKAGIADNGTVTHPEEGTPQGGPLSPILANVYLHYVLDLWFDKVVRPELRGKAEWVRYADDVLALFENETDAQRFAQMLPERLAKFGLEVAPEKTRLIPFGAKFWRQGKGVAGTFDFLGFSHHLGTSRKGQMTLVRKPTAKSVHRFFTAIKQWLRRNMHIPPRDQQRILTAKLRGYFQYCGLWFCAPTLKKLQYQVTWTWWRTLRRRSQAHKPTWEWFVQRPWTKLPAPRLCHPRV
ncbi:MAG: group II intron reverse transcriptase/maturase [Firmicutes bacterium]|nr:group II intron reverse transcriptase/maturase [Bacillota bacterium]